MMKLNSVHWVVLACLLFGGLVTGQSEPVSAQEGVQNVYVPLILDRFFIGSGEVTGKVLDASTGKVIASNAKICYYMQCTQTNTLGEYQFKAVPSGGEAFTASADGFVKETLGVTVFPNEKSILNFALPPDMSNENIAYRILLTWDPTPKWSDGWDNDLDAHLWMDALIPQHIYSGEVGDCTVFPNACLEVDVRLGFGPETIAVRELENAVYHYGVLNVNQIYSTNVPAMIDTDARIQVYDRQGLVTTIEMPTSLPPGVDPRSRDFWYVFTMDMNGNITPVNCLTIYSEEEIPTCIP
jgi:hypothetical protein